MLSSIYFLMGTTFMIEKAACLVLWFLVMFVLERLGDFNNRRLEDVGVDQDNSREKESPVSVQEPSKL